ncbi:MAG: HlyD family efflux transporter periplasmic adaptor subunit [Planctomycetes bacterium]|jgi:HlyD family secretion protein|nr:HlyD family efflux transporter periplasmic adaptor subunit [Planctomycetota bacterium]
MTGGNGRTHGAGRRLKLFGGLAIVVAIGLGVIWLTVVRGSDKPGQEVPTFTAKRGPLTISVVESGTIKARDQNIIKNEVEGRTSIITLVPEGTRVHKGDVLVVLDASTLQDGKIDQEIRVKNAEAAFINARENLAIVTSKTDSDVNEAALAVEFARQDLRKYEEGQYPKDVNEMQMRITLAQEELERAEHTLTWSNRLYEEKYVSETERMADELTVKRKKLEVDLANSNLAMLQDFTYPRQIRQYQSDVQQALSALDRATRKAEADKLQAQADLAAKEAEYTRQQAKLQKTEDQLNKTRILAPSDGLVIYATSAKGGLAGMLKEPLVEGQQVFERQELIYLPADDSAMAEVSIHEASLAKVRVGQPAIVTVETLPGKRFLGTVGLVAPLPDAAGMFLNPDLKVFKTQVHLDTDDPALRSGMTCRVEIVVEQYDDAVYVPVQAVTRVGGDALVYVQQGKSLEPRKVEIGLDNNRMIRIVNGLPEGEIVVLDPPLKASSAESAPSAGAEPNAAGEKRDNFDQQVRSRLNASQKAGGVKAKGPGDGAAGKMASPPPAGPMPNPQMPGAPGALQGTPPPGAPMPPNMQNLSPEQQKRMQEGMQKAMEVMKNLSEEEKEKLKNMSPEERMQFFQEKMGGGRQK